MGPAGTSRSGVRACKIDDEGDMGKAGGRVWGSGIGLLAGMSGTPNIPAERQFIGAAAEGFTKLSPIWRFTFCEFAAAP
jgi:hypothetical protein